MLMRCSAQEYSYLTNILLIVPTGVVAFIHYHSEHDVPFRVNVIKCNQQQEWTSHLLKNGGGAFWPMPVHTVVGSLIQSGAGRDPAHVIPPADYSETETTYCGPNIASDCSPSHDTAYGSREKKFAQLIERTKPKTPKKWSRSLIVLTATVLVTQLLTTAGYTIISPFFPQEAKKKGLTETQIGLVFASTETAMFITSPIYGSLVSLLCMWETRSSKHEVRKS